MSGQTTVIIVDDHAIVRQGIRTALEVDSQISVIGEAISGEEAVEVVAELVPDVILLDLVMPGIGGVEATRQIKQVSPNTQVIVITSYYDDQYIFPALQAGALSYILKDVSIHELINVIHKAARGESVLHPCVVSRVVQDQHSARRKASSLFVKLSERELDVLRLIAVGFTNATIAEKLVISEKTVKVHVSNILSKLNILDRTQAAVFAWQQGLIHKTKDDN